MRIPELAHAFQARPETIHLRNPTSAFPPVAPKIWAPPQLVFLRERTRFIFSDPPGGDRHAPGTSSWEGIVTFLAAVFFVETFFVTPQLRVPFALRQLKRQLKSNRCADCCAVVEVLPPFLAVNFRFHRLKRSLPTEKRSRPRIGWAT